MGNNYFTFLWRDFYHSRVLTIIIIPYCKLIIIYTQIEIQFLLLVQMLFEIHLKHPILTNSVVWLSYILKVNVFYLQAYQPRILNPASFSALANGLRAVLAEVGNPI